MSSADAPTGRCCGREASAVESIESILFALALNRPVQTGVNLPKQFASVPISTKVFTAEASPVFATAHRTARKHWD